MWWDEPECPGDPRCSAWSRRSAAAPALTAQQPAGAWDSVARALGRSGPAGGETYRATFPRTDLQVSVSGARIAPALALTSWAAFAGSPDSADVMGDLVLPRVRWRMWSPRSSTAGST